MYEKLKPLYDEGPCNRTDPILRHDPDYSASMIAVPYKPQGDVETHGVSNIPVDNTMYDGVYYPLIRMNSTLIPAESIISFKYHNDRFTPYIDLVFRDLMNVEFADMPGIDNTITVMLFESADSPHRPIKTDFYITKCDKRSNIFYIQAEFKCLPLEKLQFKQEVFHWPQGGCQSKWCQLGPDKYPNTYEFLHVIAENSGLGFAATQKCRSIKDNKNRILSSVKYKDAAKNAIAVGGLDEDSYFDGWIDPYGTLTLVNVSWVLNQTVTPDELAIKASVGIKGTGFDAGKMYQTKLLHRIISNFSAVPDMNNMMATDMYKLVDLKSGWIDGTKIEYNIYDGAGSASGNDDKLRKIDTKVVENSIEGQKHAKDDDFRYGFERQEFSGVEMAMKTPWMKQKRERTEYFKKLRSSEFLLKMSYLNFGLERGMLVCVVWYTIDFFEKSIVQSHVQNLGDDQSIDKKDNVPADAQFQETSNMLDPVKSGVFYIDAIEYVWDPDYGITRQYLYLIKKGMLTQYSDSTVPPKVSPSIKTA